MGYQDRDYYQDSGSGNRGWGMDSPPVIKWIIFANVAVFLAQIFVSQPPSPDQTAQMKRLQHDLTRLHKQQVDRFNDAAKGKNDGTNGREGDEEEVDRQIEELTEQIQRLAIDGGGSMRVSLVQNWFQLDVEKVIYQGQVWRLFTYGFCHERFGIWHLFWNMFLLYWCGVTIESMLGSKEFLLFYLMAILLAGLAYLGLELYAGKHHPMIGASGGIMAVVMLYACHFPYQTILLFWVIPVQIRWLVLLYVLVDAHPVLLILSGERHVATGIAHAAHLGGAAFGFFYWRFDWRLESLADRVTTVPRPRRRRPRLRVVRAEDDEPASVPIGLPDRVDEILKKVHEQGKESLTEDEVAILNEASERLKRARRS